MRLQNKTTSHYNQWSQWGKEDEANRERAHQTLALIPAEVKNILDVGCGDGALSNELVSRGLQVTGLDISQIALGFFEGDGVIGSIERMSFSDKYFDLVLCAEVIEHLQPEIYSKALLEIERVAKVYIIITTPNMEYLPVKYTCCQNCGKVYHVNLHYRAFSDENHRTLFRNFRKLITINIQEWAHNPSIIFIEQQILKYYRFKKDVICPHCGFASIQPPKLGFIRENLLKAIQVLSKLFPVKKKPRWIASLFTTQNPSVH